MVNGITEFYHKTFFNCTTNFVTEPNPDHFKKKIYLSLSDIEVIRFYGTDPPTPCKPH
jgi:hypothetical protein